MSHVRPVAVSAGASAAVIYVLGVLYDLVAPASLHVTRWMQAIFPGYHALSLSGFFLGLAEAAAYGIAVGALGAALYSGHRRHWGAATRLSHRPRI